MVDNCLTSMTLSLYSLLIMRNKVKPIIGASAFRLLEDIEESLIDVVNAFNRSINH